MRASAHIARRSASRRFRAARWLSTSRAHRLRKPCTERPRPLAPLVTQRRSRRALHARRHQRLQRLASHGNRALRQDRGRLRAGSTGAKPGRGAFRRQDLRPCGRGRLARAHGYVRPRSPRTRSPAATRPSLSGNGRHVRLPRGLARLSARFVLLGKMRLTDFCNRHYNTSTLRNARFSNHHAAPLSPDAAASARPASAETESEPRIEWGLV